MDIYIFLYCLVREHSVAELVMIYYNYMYEVGDYIAYGVAVWEDQ